MFILKSEFFPLGTNFLADTVMVPQLHFVFEILQHHTNMKYDSGTYRTNIKYKEQTEKK